MVSQSTHFMGYKLEQDLSRCTSPLAGIPSNFWIRSKS